MKKGTVGRLMYLSRYDKAKETNYENYEALRAIQNIAIEGLAIPEDLLPYLIAACKCSISKDAYARQQKTKDKWPDAVWDVQLLMRLGSSFDEALKDVSERLQASGEKCTVKNLEREYKRHKDARADANFMYENSNGWDDPELIR